MKYSPERERTISGLRRVTQAGPAGLHEGRQDPPCPRRPRRRRPVDQPGACMTDREARKRRHRRRDPVLRVVRMSRAMSCVGSGSHPIPRARPASTSPIAGPPRHGARGPKGTLERAHPGRDHGPPGRRPAPRRAARRRAREPCAARPRRVRSSTTWSSASPQGFVKELEIVGVGYRATAQGTQRHRAGARLQPSRSGARRRRASTFEVPQPTRIVVRGIDKEVVGQVAANIRKIRKPEPYKGKGVRYAGRARPAQGRQDRQVGHES